MYNKQHLIHLIHLIAVFIACTFVSTPALSQTETPKQIHTPPEILKIIEDSQLCYEISENNDMPASEKSPRILPPDLYLKQEDAGYSLAQFSISDKACQVLEQAETAFKSKDFTKAIELYNQVLIMQPDFYYILTMIGDTYYNLGLYENAKTFLLQSIEKNFISYQAHWFLSDTYYKIGDIDSALKEITIAHLLNVNNQGIQKGIRYYRTKLQRPWKEWTFDPQYNLSKDGDKVTIKASEEWLGYALVKALWAYEPGYVESMLGEPRGTRMVVWPEEQEAVVVLMAANNKFKNIEEVFEKGYFTEFITYEMLGKKYPDALVLMPREAFMRIVEYVNAFH